MYENVIYGPSHFCVENSLAWVIHVYAKVPCIMYINLKYGSSGGSFSNVITYVRKVFVVVTLSFNADMVLADFEYYFIHNYVRNYVCNYKRNYV